jgi:hypothetical protein|eukprot:COSAG01_NODE_3933_length_5521_cov_11.179823_2_plen_195_part_00
MHNYLARVKSISCECTRSCRALHSITYRTSSNQCPATANDGNEIFRIFAHDRVRAPYRGRKRQRKHAHTQSAYVCASISSWYSWPGILPHVTPDAAPYLLRVLSIDISATQYIGYSQPIQSSDRDNCAAEAQAYFQSHPVNFLHESFNSSIATTKLWPWYNFPCRVVPLLIFPTFVYHGTQHMISCESSHKRRR